MGWDESLFGWAYARARAWTQKAVPPDVLARRAVLEGSRDRLRLVACALAGRSLEVQEAENEGGFAGQTLLLPKWIDVAETLEANRDAYVIRIAWSVSALQQGLVLSRHEEDPMARILATVLAAPATKRALTARYPAAAERLSALESRALAAMPSLDAIPHGAVRVLSALVRARLGEERPRLLDARERAWMERAVALTPDGSASLENARSSLITELRALGAASARRPSVPIQWGYVGTRGASDAAALGRAGSDAEALPSGTELRARARENVRRVTLPDDPLADDPVVHSFEKVHTAEDHRGGSKTTDGSDQLEDHAQALDELELREVVRSTERTSSLLRCDAMIEGGASDLMDEGVPPPGDGIPYDEWNEKARAYRRAWCHVRVGVVLPRVPKRDADAFVWSVRARGARHVRAVRTELERVEHARRWRGGQLDGSEIDDDRVVDRIGALAAGHGGSERLHRARRRTAPGLSVLLLIDGSLSTDAWVANRRVLDVELESAHVIAEALDGLSIDVGIAAFHSHTRRDCRFLVLKDVDEPWARARHRSASLSPTGYTRIGPALRHGAHVLARSEARRRLLLLLTDGKPNDYDRYEGTYGVADVRQAVREVTNEGVHVHALAIDPSARFHLPKMFGPGGHSVVARPDDLALALGRVCAQMAR